MRLIVADAICIAVLVLGMAVIIWVARAVEKL